MEDNRLMVIDEEGNEMEMEIMFTFNHEGKDYVVYYDPNSQEEEIDVFASIYDENGNLYPIESDEEWDIIDQMLESFTNDSDDEEDQ